jgi:transposase-like protein
VDGLKGFPEAIEAIFPQTVVQTCIVHLIRYSLKYVPRRQYDQVAKDLKPIYTAGDVDQALEALEAFEHKWGKQLRPVVKAWRDSWEYGSRSWPFLPTSAGWFTRQIPSRRSTGSCEKRSRPKDTSR